MNDLLNRRYEAFYRSRDPVHVYPVEFVVRAFLGKYPRLQADARPDPGARVLDLGFGDGRNMSLLSQLGLEVHGVEITQDICDRTQARMSRLGIDVVTRVGQNHRIPYPTSFFDIVLACHACYYVEKGSRFENNVEEIARVLKPGGTFIFSAPMGTSYILRGARDLGEAHMEIVNDPYRLRNGSILKKFDRESDIKSALTPAFQEFSIGSCRNDFWGIEEHVWIVVCRRA